MFLASAARRKCRRRRPRAAEGGQGEFRRPPSARAPLVATAELVCELAVVHKPSTHVAEVPEVDRPPLAKDAELRSSDGAQAVAEDALGVLGAR